MNFAGAVAIIRPFSGSEPCCRICAGHGASMSYAFIEGLGDLLLRKCRRCHYGWYEHPPTHDSALPTGNHI